MNWRTAAEAIKASVDCRKYLTKSQSGLYNCPFCGSGTNGNNNTGALKYYETTNTWACFACKANGAGKFTGDVIDLYIKETGKDWHNSVIDLARQAGILEPIEFDLPGKRSTAAEDFKTPAAAPAAHSLIGQTAATQPPADYRAYYAECMSELQNADEAKAYLQGRGISLETAIACNIGFDRRADPANAPGALKTDPKRHPAPRLIIPTSAAHYVGRRIDGGKEFEKLNSKGSAPGIFFSQALDSGADYIFVTEGAFDAMSVLEVNQMAIALNSASNCDLLINTLEAKPITSTLILCLDADKAGKAATDKLREGLRRLNVSFITADINCGHKDPNEALVADREAFTAAVKRATESTAARPDNTALYLDEMMAGDLERRRAAGKKPTGLQNLDAATGGGLRPGLFLIGAGTSIGKTTFCSQLADGLAENGSDVIYFSLEQSRLEMMAKSLSRGTAVLDMKNAVTGSEIMDGHITPLVMQAVERHKATVGNRLSLVEAGFNADANYITDYVRRYVRENGTRPVVFVDYLQILLPGTDKRTDKREAVEESLSKLVLLKRELDLTIIAIVSLNRNSYLQPFSFESIKETGLAEFSADAVWGLQLQCFDEPLFDEEKKLKEKRERVKEARAEIPRKIKLVSLKHRGQQAIYSCSFTYYPQYDLFVPAPDAPAVRKITAGGKAR